MRRELECLVSAQQIAGEFIELVDEATKVIVSQRGAYLSGESILKGKGEDIWVRHVEDSPERFIETFSLLLEANNRAICSLIAKNNCRMLSLMGLIPQ